MLEFTHVAKPVIVMPDLLNLDHFLIVDCVVGLDLWEPTLASTAPRLEIVFCRVQLQVEVEDVGGFEWILFVRNYVIEELFPNKCVPC